MATVVHNRPAVFTALVVVERLVRKVEEGEEWGVILDRLATTLLNLDVITGQPLLIKAALHPVGHLLAREIVTRANYLYEAKTGLLIALNQHLDILKGNKTGANVLRGLQGVI